MAKATADRDEMVSEIHNAIDRIKALIGEGNPEAAGELSAEAEVMITKLSGSGSVALRKSLRDQVREALETRAPNEDESSASTEVAVSKGPETIREVEGLAELIEHGAERVRAVTENKIRGGREIAEVLMDIRRRITLPDGTPDLMGDSNAAKKASSAIYTRVTSKLPKEGTDDFSDNIREEIKSIKRGAQTAMADVRVEFALALDTTEDPEMLEPFKAILMEGVRPSVAVAAHYDFELKFRREIERERREAKALEAKRAESGSEDGEDQGEGPAVTPLESMSDDEIAGLSDNAKAQAREQIEAKITALTNLLAKLA